MKNRKPADSIPEPSPVFAVPEKTPSSDPHRVAVRIDGLTYLIWADQVDSFKARLVQQSKRNARAEIY